MLTTKRRMLGLTGMTMSFATLGALALGAAALPAHADDSAAYAALRRLYKSHPEAEQLAQRAAGVLIFPDIVKAGFVVGAQTGNGLLLVGGKPAGRYNISAASYGLQAGVQSFSYALFFMTPSSLQYLRDSGGFAIGAGPSVVVVDEGMAKSITSTTLSQDVYAFPFGERGLMAGIGLEGSKITQIAP